tara:strand:+ start:8322 stop:8525 length:204 start_codon:yes stop_codon:yes gene_type:complete
MDFKNGINDIEAYKQQLMSQLTPEQQKLVNNSIAVMSTATNPEELKMLENQEIKKLENGYKDSTKGN